MILRKLISIIILCIVSTTIAYASSKIGECLGNLRIIDSAKRMYADDHEVATGDEVTMEDLYPYINMNLECPSGGEYVIGPIGTPTKCTYPSHSIEGLREIRRGIVREHLILSYYAISIIFGISFLGVYIIRKFQSVVALKKLKRFPYIYTFFFAYIVCNFVLLYIWHDSLEPPPLWFICLFPALTTHSSPRWL